jgi:hypothetical protein
MNKYVSIPLLAVMFASAGLHADVLDMKNGTVLNGKPVGGTATTVRFETLGNLQVLPAGTRLLVKEFTYEFSRSVQGAHDLDPHTSRPGGDASPPSSTMGYWPLAILSEPPAPRAGYGLPDVADDGENTRSCRQYCHPWQEG